MRKLILITVLMLASASAFAGETRSLTLASNDVTTFSQPTQPIVDRAAVREVSIKLAQAAEPMTTQVQSDAPTQTTTTQVQTQAPVQTQAATTTTTTTTADTKPATTKSSTKTTRRESDEHKARRIAAKYGVSW